MFRTVPRLIHLPAVPGRFVGAACMRPGRGAPHAGFAVYCPFPSYNTMPPRKRPMPQCLRAAYMRPLQCEENVIQTVNGQCGHRFAGGIYAWTKRDHNPKTES